MGRYVRMDPEPVFGQSEPPRPPMSPFIEQVLRSVLWSIVGPPAPVFRKQFKGWSRGLLGVRGPQR